MAITMWSCLLVKRGRYDLTPERVGINIDDARIPDNKGNRLLMWPFKKMAHLPTSQTYLLKR